MIAGAVAAAAATLAVFYLAACYGLIPSNADGRPPSVEKWIAKKALDAAVARLAARDANPIPQTDENLLAGVKLYAENCAVCHGAADAKASPVAMGLYQKAPQLAKYGVEDDPDGEVYWIVAHGIRMTGMPAFGGSLSQDELWKLVLFLKNMDSLPPGPQRAWQAVPSAAARGAQSQKRGG